MNVRISARAQIDLENILTYIGFHRGPEAADQFHQSAKNAVGFLAANPMAGPHPRWSTKHWDLRFWVITRTNYLIFYFAEERGVSIERVLDGRRDVARIIELGIEEPPDNENSQAP
jgi:plasmid stabilization system protein ParE